MQGGGVDSARLSKATLSATKRSANYIAYDVVEEYMKHRISVVSEMPVGSSDLANKCRIVIMHEYASHSWSYLIYVSKKLQGSYIQTPVGFV